MPFHKLPPAARAWILASLLLASTLLLVTFKSERILFDREFGLLIALAVIANLPRVNLTARDGKMTLNYAIVFLVTMLYGRLSNAVLIAALSGLTGTVLIKRQPLPDGTIPRRVWYKPAFTVANLVESAWVSTLLWKLALRLSHPAYESAGFLVGVIALSGSYFLLNTGGIALVVTLVQDRRPWESFRLWKEDFLWTFPGYLCAVCVAGGVTLLSRYPAMGLWSFLLLPPVYVVYYSYKLYLDKIHYEVNQLNALNALNARVISTLAMTIEAKDRYTHKHVERVREYALGIARELHVTSEELEAIRIGAMVHDIGKIAVPESILMKPGKLTPEEFERIKTHVLVGVKILEVVNFPFPVADAVAAHHERWDGNGYPYGLKGEEIPLVGRIVALADGFDALTSDRHYRKGLSHEEALELIVSQAGQQYDPSVIDALVAVLPQVEPTIRDLNQAESAPEELSGHRRMIPQEALVEIAQAAEEAVVLAEIPLRPNASHTSQEVIDLLIEKAMRLIPATTVAVYIWDEETQEIHVRGCAGLYAALFEGLSMKPGEGVSGRVFARGESLVNEPAANDLARRIEPGRNLELNGTLSAPLRVGDASIGAITLYHTGYNLYNAHYQRLLVMLAEHAASTLDTLVRLETNQALAHTDSLTGLPNMRYLIQRLEEAVTEQRAFSVLLLDLNGFKQINDTRGHLAGDQVLRDTARILRESTRADDLVGRYAGDEFLVICPERSVDEALRIGERIKGGFQLYSLMEGGRPSLTTSVGVAGFPDDGPDWRSLLSVADQRMYRDKLKYQGHHLADEPERTVERMRSAVP